jgi:hypothetical protein
MPDLKNNELILNLEIGNFKIEFIELEKVEMINSTMNRIE